ncbi:MAG: hypothetical protein AAF631_08905 [Pseudomonadota bacterium]
MATLKKPKKIVLKAKDAVIIAKYIFGSCKVAQKDFTEKDIGFIQAILTEMIDKSFAMGFIEKLFDSVKIGSNAKTVVKNFVKGAGKTLIKYKDKDDLQKMIDDPYIYESVLKTAKNNFRKDWKFRENHGSYMTY